MRTSIRIAVSICLALVLVLAVSVVAFGDTGGSAGYVQYCAGCHGSDGQGTAYGPDIQGESAGEVTSVTRSGDDEMPAFDSSVISDAELEALAAYVAGLSAAGDQYSGYNLALICGTVYWASWEDYTDQLLSVDYGILNNGNETAHHVYVKSATATKGVTASWFSARSWYEIAPGETVDFTIKWLIPTGVGNFISTLEVCAGCGHRDDGSSDHGSYDSRSNDDDHGSDDYRTGDSGSRDGDGYNSWREGSRDEGSRDD